MSFSYDIYGFNAGTGTGLSIFDVGFEDMAKKALNECRPEIETETKAALRQSIQHPGDSELVNSVKSYEARMTTNDEGAVVTCLPTGKPSKKTHYYNHDRGRTVTKTVANNDKAFWLEYGNAHQNAHPWRDRANANIEAKCLNKIENTIAKELGAE